MSTPSFPAAWGPLPSGRHRISRDEVLASQRGRILASMAAAVTEHGYGAVAVGDVVRRANVSKRTFYEHFPDKESCFLATFDTGIEFVLARTREAVEDVPADDWPARLRIGLAAYLDVLAAEPEFAWALEIESLAAGPVVAARRAEATQLFANTFRHLHDLARKEDRSRPTQPDEVFTALAGGVDEVIRETLRTTGAAALPARLEVLLRFLETTVFTHPGATPRGAR